MKLFLSSLVPEAVVTSLVLFLLLESCVFALTSSVCPASSALLIFAKPVSGFSAFCLSSHCFLCCWFLLWSQSFLSSRLGPVGSPGHPRLGSSQDRAEHADPGLALCPGAPASSRASSLRAAAWALVWPPRSFSVAGFCPQLPMYSLVNRSYVCLASFFLVSGRR